MKIPYVLRAQLVELTPVNLIVDAPSCVSWNSRLSCISWKPQARGRALCDLGVLR